MKTPKFWYAQKKNSLCSILLMPFAGLYERAAHMHRANSNPLPVTAPVICLGNLVAGGSGKTPTAISLMKLLRDSNFFLSPCFVTRGYGGKIKGPERVDDTNSAVFWGDEALLLARTATTYVSANRYEGAEAAIFNGADAIILDDGLQNYDLQKDISFAVMDGRMGFGNEKVIPAGPLRQPIEDGIERTDAFILIGEDTRGVLTRIPPDKPVFRASIKVRDTIDLPNVPYIAFCGIGFPEKFRDTINELKIDCVGFHAYPDHYSFTIDDMGKLVDEALTKKARLLTTEKDFVRLPDFAKKALIDVLPIEIVFEDNESILNFIRSLIRQTPA
jgi:tetraacyldisaccharide 4'-kinase